MPTSSDRKKYVKRTCTGEITKGQGGFQEEQLTFHFDKPQREVNWNKSFSGS